MPPYIEEKTVQVVPNVQAFKPFQDTHVSCFDHLRHEGGLVQVLISNFVLEFSKHSWFDQCIALLTLRLNPVLTSFKVT